LTTTTAESIAHAAQYFVASGLTAQLPSSHTHSDGSGGGRGASERVVDPGRTVDVRFRVGVLAKGDVGFRACVEDLLGSTGGGGKGGGGGGGGGGRGKAEKGTETGTDTGPRQRRRRRRQPRRRLLLDLDDDDGGGEGEGEDEGANVEGRRRRHPPLAGKGLSNATDDDDDEEGRVWFSTGLTVAVR